MTVIFWSIFEWVVVISIFVIIASQILIPLWKGTKLFPTIRRRELEIQMKEVKDTADKQKYLEEIEEEVKKIK